MMNQFLQAKIKMTKQGGLRVLCGTACCPPYSSARLVSPIAQAGVEETNRSVVGPGLDPDREVSIKALAVLRY